MPRQVSLLPLGTALVENHKERYQGKRQEQNLEENSAEPQAPDSSFAQRKSCNYMWSQLIAL